MSYALPIGASCRLAWCGCVLALFSHVHAATPCEPEEFDLLAQQALGIAQSIEQAIDVAAYADNPDAAYLGWDGSYALMALVSLYEATGQVGYLQQVKDQADLIFANRGDRLDIMDQLRGVIMPAWMTDYYTSPGQHHAWLVHQGMITFPIARWIYLVKQDPALRAQYGADADSYQADIIETLMAFDGELHSGPNPGELYYDLHYISGNMNPMPYNMQNAAGRTFTMLWLLTGDNIYRTRAEGLALFFKNRLTATGDRYTWAYSSTETGAEDVSHAAMNVDFAFKCYRSEIVFDADDMAAFSATYQHISKGSVGFADFVDGTDYPESDYSRDVGLWTLLGYYDPMVRLLYNQFYEGNWRNDIVYLAASAHLAETSHPFQFESPLPGPEAPVIRLVPSMLTVTAEYGESPADQTFDIDNVGINTLTYQISGDVDWLSVTPAGGSVTCGVDEITVQYDTDSLCPGDHTGVITVSAPGGANDPQTLDVHLTIDPPPSDFDGDCDVDQEDFGQFQACLTGPGLGPPIAGCEDADLDHDSDVDQADFGGFQRCFSGPNIPVDPSCLD